MTKKVLEDPGIKDTNNSEPIDDSVSKNKKCGIVMPIAPHPDYPLSHWSDVLEILTSSLDQTEFITSIVSTSDEIGLIHERIVNNLYSNEIVICDVSSKNPNVMFELGMRLAFDKPTIIIKDDKTGYSFDTGPIEHLTYPSSLRYAEIEKFKSDLRKRVIATYKKSIEDPHYSPFLKSFGTKIIPSKINEKEISESSYVIDSLNQIKAQLNSLRVSSKPDMRSRFNNTKTKQNSLLKMDNYSISVYSNEADYVTKKISNLLKSFNLDYSIVDTQTNNRVSFIIKSAYQEEINEIFSIVNNYEGVENIHLETLPF